MGKQIGQPAKVTPLLPANSTTRTSTWPRCAERESQADPIRVPRTIVAPFACHVRSFTWSPYPAARSRMLSELAPVMTTTLYLIPGIKFCFLPSTFHFQI